MTHHLSNRPRPKRIFASERLNLMTHRFCKSFRRFLGVHDKATPCRRSLQIGKKNSRWSQIAEIENPCIPCNAHDFDISIRYDANALADGVAVREQAFRETAAHDRNMWMPPIICLIEVSAANQRNSERSEKTRRNHRSIRPHLGSYGWLPWLGPHVVLRTHLTATYFRLV